MSVDKTLEERGARYGQFAEHARIAQGIQDVMRANPSWDTLDHDMKQALTVIADKIARILNGDPFYADNWHDIQGYAKLVETRINGTPTGKAELFDEAQGGKVSQKIEVTHQGIDVDKLRDALKGYAKSFPTSVFPRSDGYSYNKDGAVIGGAGGGGYYD